MKSFFRVAVGGIFIAGAAVWGAAAYGNQGRPSVLLITLDTTRADKLGCYGNQGGLTPSLDGLAQRCYVFDHCESSVPETMPSHATILSGWYPYRHGVRKNLEASIPANVPMLASDFKAHGYSTGAFVSAWILLGRYGFAKGFDTYDDSFAQKTYNMEAQRRADVTLKLADNWLRKQSGPWFCWIHLFDPHEPYDPPESYAMKYKSHPYDGEIAFMDDALGSLFSVLLARSQLENTIVVVCGDHGESLGEHGELTHGVFIYESTTHVPLMIHLPGQAEERRLPNVVGLVDVAPTIRELCGFKTGKEDGHSLVMLMQGKSTASYPVYIESMDPLLAYGWAPLYGWAQDNYKYILAPHDELYNIKSDPEEKQNLVTRDKGQAEAMKSDLKHVLTLKPSPTEPIKLDQEELEALKSLGYVEGAPGLKGATYADPKDKIVEYEKLQEARRLLNENRAKDAATVFQKLYDSGSHSPEVLYGLCMSYYSWDQDRSLKYALETIRRRPDFPQPYERALMIELSRGNYLRAKQLADVGIRETGDFGGALSVQGAWAAYYLNRPDGEILPYLDKSSGQWGGHYMAAKLRALLALRRGNRTEAIKWVEAMAKTAPADAVAALAKEDKFKPLVDDSQFKKILADAHKNLVPKDGH